jgi:peptide/nickel transport system permease protein
VTAGRLSGLGNVQLIRQHVLPNLAPLLVVAGTLSLGTAILMESTISFLGLGIKPPTASLGSIVSLALEPGAFRSTPWIWLPGAIVLAALVVAVNLIGDALRSTLDPSTRGAAS